MSTTLGRVSTVHHRLVGIRRRQRSPPPVETSSLVWAEEDALIQAKEEALVRAKEEARINSS